jgi:peptide/nickel transport system substrate-binding protein
MPKDPDQYMLWHSSQQNNISNYKNLRIDKLLEDGRQTQDQDQRVKLYEDFQKYLLDDPPATFLYFPYVYDIKRK